MFLLAKKLNNSIITEIKIAYTKNFNDVPTIKLAIAPEITAIDDRIKTV